MQMWRKERISTFVIHSKQRKHFSLLSGVYGFTRAPPVMQLWILSDFLQVLHSQNMRVDKFSLKHTGYLFQRRRRFETHRTRRAQVLLSASPKR